MPSARPSQSEPIKSVPGLGAAAIGGLAASRGWILVILTILNALNFLDRQVAFILAEPIKIDLHLTDTEIGALTGLAFAVLYTTLGIPLAGYADRPKTHRIRLIVICTTVWSAMTVVCGLAQSFTQLLLARIGVGVGEAGLTPAAQAVLAEIYPREQRARALGFYLSGIPLGKLFGLVIGGVVAQTFGWRMAFAVVGLPGLIAALIAWRFVPEPRRGAQGADGGEAESFWRACRAMLRLPSYWFAALGCTVVSFVTTAQTAFLGSFLIRSHGFNVGWAGLALGLAIGGGGLIGAVLAGFAADAGGKHDVRAFVAIPGLCSLIGAILFMAALYVAQAWIMLALLTLSQGLFSTWYGPVAALNQHLAGPKRRSVAVGLSLFVINLVGIGFGPLAAGAISDVLHHGAHIAGAVIPVLGSAQGLRAALAVVTTATLFATLFFWLAAVTVGRDMALAEGGPALG